MGFLYDDDEVEKLLGQALSPDPKIRAKQQRRAARETELADKTIAANLKLTTGKLYGVIYADPPWRFEPYSRQTGLGRAPDIHYPTMTTADIAALPVPVAKDAVLFLWAMTALLPQALEVMTAWGFSYKSNAVWIKDRIGTGWWFRNRHELLLVGTRGKIPAPAPGTQFESVINAPRTAHSQKPESVAAMIETLFPNLPKLELFARVTRPGWDAWGNETDKDEEAQR